MFATDIITKSDARLLVVVLFFATLVMMHLLHKIAHKCKIINTEKENDL